MAIKSSNQITFTEHKKIIEIKEWYLATSKDTGVTIETPGWTTNIQTIDYSNKYLWNYEEVIYSIGSSDTSDPVIIGVYGESGSSLQIKYLSSPVPPIIYNNDVSAWSDTVPVSKDREKVYMTQKLSTDTNWSIPIQISALDGETPTMTIVDGYWCVNGESTGIKAEGTDGNTPEVTIGDNGNWFVDGVDTGVKAQGEAGKDGTSIEYVYYRSKEEASLSAPSYTNGILTSGWTPSPSGITLEYQYEYVSVRTKPTGSFWGTFSTPVIWSKWGEKGQDGDGVEYKYYLSNSSTPPTYSAGDTKWTDNPQGVTKDNQYEYVVQIKTSASETTVSSPSLWAKYGEDGRGISRIINYYQITPDTVVPNTWQESMDGLKLTSENKYLWNYEEIRYTEGNPTITDPAIIGVYGDSGADTVDFQIYSVNGFEFSDTLTSIELKTVAFKSGVKLEDNDVSYQWKWWNEESNSYEAISDATTPTFVVNIDDIYSYTGLKCEITYDDIVYEDYVSLTKKASIYTATVKFFNGSNIISSDNDYLIVYVELYKDNNPEELLHGDSIYKSDANIVQNGIISTDLSGEYANDDIMYFVCSNVDTDEYNVVCGQYTSGQWNVVPNNYVYHNDLHINTLSPVVFVPKEKISRSLNINFTILDGDSIIARTNTIVFDLNDPSISNTPPTDPKEGQLWLDTSVSPGVLKMWDGTNWVNSGYQNGNVVYTSKPEDGYSEGDLWILSEEDAELFENFGSGTMLKAIVTSTTFNSAHWIDVDEEGTEQKNNIRQYFLFNKDTGLRIGQADDQFYVNISSTEMGFYDATSGTAQKVVSISNQSATIKNLTVEDSAKFNCEVQFGNFILKTESNGSLSLALAT